MNLLGYIVDPNDEIILLIPTHLINVGDVLLWDHQRVVHCSYPGLGSVLTTTPAEELLLQTG
jgi:hypothetical protein